MKKAITIFSMNIAVLIASGCTTVNTDRRISNLEAQAEAQNVIALRVDRLEEKVAALEGAEVTNQTGKPAIDPLKIKKMQGASQTGSPRKVSPPSQTPVVNSSSGINDNLQAITPAIDEGSLEQANDIKAALAELEISRGEASGSAKAAYDGRAIERQVIDKAFPVEVTPPAKDNSSLPEVPQLSPLTAVPHAREPEIISRPGIPARYDGNEKRPAPRAVQPKQGPVATGQSSSSLLADARSGNVAYDSALSKYYSKDFTGAIKGFQAFLAKSPNSKLAANAVYWEGESYYSQGDYSTAILRFKSVAAKYSGHAKVSAALLKLGMAYAELHDMENARFYWQILVDDFPRSQPAALARKKMAQ